MCGAVCLLSYEYGFDASSFVCLRMVASVGEHLESAGRLPEDRYFKFSVVSSAY